MKSLQTRNRLRAAGRWCRHAGRPVERCSRHAGLWVVQWMLRGGGLTIHSIMASNRTFL